MMERDARAVEEVVECGGEARDAMRGQLNGAGNGVECPAQEGLISRPTGIAFAEFAGGDGFATLRTVLAIVGTEDGIHGM